MARLNVEVVRADKLRQQVVKLVVEQGASVADAARASGLISPDHAASGEALPLGIYGKSVAPDTILRDGDRVEIYRPLKLDPKAARRKKAAMKLRRSS